jgi:hypothetical protein
MPSHRVPTIMVHMAGLRQESWGRRVMMRAFGVWQDGADAVAPDAWVSARSLEASRAPAADAAARRHAWTGSGRLLTTLDVAHPSAFASMQNYDRFACRLLILGLLLRRRVVFPPIDCALPYMQKALQARHLRGMEVGCGDDRQCVWLPYPHHIEPWCAGVDFLYDIDYRGLVSRGEVRPASDAVGLPLSSLRQAMNASHGPLGPLSRLRAELHNDAKVLQLRGTPFGGKASGGGLLGAAASLLGGRQAPPVGTETESLQDQLAWLPLGGFRTEQWRAPLPRRVEAFLRTPAGDEPHQGLGLSDAQVKIVKTCLRSLATSKE